MKRDSELVERRKQFVLDYLDKNKDKQMKTLVIELQNILFLSERTIWNIIKS